MFQLQRNRKLEWSIFVLTAVTSYCQTTGFARDVASQSNGNAITSRCR